MSLAIRAVQLTLIVLTGVAFYETHGLALKNGTFDLIRDVLENGSKKLPLSKEPLKTVYTGIGPIDHQLQILTAFFWPLLASEEPSTSLQSSYFAGQFAIAHALVSLEGMRKANKGRIISYILIWGAFFQNVAYAVTIPAMLAVHLATSPTILPSAPEILPSAAEVAALPASITLGFIIPAYLMALPSPAKTTSDQKQIYMAIWQFFPLWVSIFQQVFKRVLAGVSTSLSKPSRTTTVWALRFSYGFCLAITALTHLSSIAEAISFDLYPQRFVKAIGSDMGVYKTFVPASYLHTDRVASITDGAFLFLQWDLIIGTSSHLLWAVTTLLCANPAKGSGIAPLALTLAGALGFVIAGPIGCTTLLLWIRDEVVLERTGSTSKKNN